MTTIIMALMRLYIQMSFHMFVEFPFTSKNIVAIIENDKTNGFSPECMRLCEI